MHPAVQFNSTYMAAPLIAHGGVCGNVHDIHETIARTLINFQDEYLARWPSQGLLCQTWWPCDPQEVDPEQLPDASSMSNLVLRTKGHPFFVAGQSGADYLAFFRCISCRYTFGTDVQVPRELGAPGRVWISGKPEALGNVGAMTLEEFHRSDHAKTCSVKCCLLLPVYYRGREGQCVCILEVLTNNTDLAYTRMGALFAKELAKYGLVTCPLSYLEMGSEGAGEICPSLQQGLSAAPFVEHGQADWEGREGPGEGEASRPLAAASDSARLGMTLADLKLLMKERRIKTLSRMSMGRYEEEVDLVLNENVALEGGKRKLPSEIGVDSRWEAARRKPQKQIKQVSGQMHLNPQKDQKQHTQHKDQKQHTQHKDQKQHTQHKDQKQHTQQKRTTRMWGTSTSRDLQAGFPVVREANGKLVADVEMITGRTNGPLTVTTTNTKPREDLPDSPSNGLLGHADRAGSGGVGSGTPSISAGDSEDWLGMIDPQMLDLLVRDDVIEAVGNLDDIQLF